METPHDTEIEETSLPAAEVRIRMEAQLAEMLVARSRHAALNATAGTLLLAWLQLDHVALSTILTWFILVTIPDALTLVSSYIFNRVRREFALMRFWKWQQAMLHWLAGLAWGSSTLFFVDANTSMVHELQIAMILVAVISLCVTAMSPSLPSLVGFILCVVVLPISHYLFGPHYGHLWMAISFVVLAASAIYYGLVAHRQACKQVRASVLNEHLVSQISTANKKIKQANADLQQRNLALSDAMAKLDEQATHDELTGLYNRRFILARLEELLQEVRRYGTTVSLAMLDIDHFKAVNDRYGHRIGDMVLKGFAERVQGELRQGDLFARYGGEEFLLVLPMTDIEAAGQLAERMRGCIEDFPVISEPVTIVVRSSFGVAQLSRGEAVQDCIARADEMLYLAKRSGRNKVFTAKN